MINREEMKMEMISKVNKEALEAYIQKTDTGNLDSCNLTNTLSAWAESKMYIYEKFGRELRLEKEVECNVSERQCDEFKSDFLGEHSSPKYLIANAFISAISMGEASANYLDKDYWIFGTKFAKGMRVSRCLKQMLPSKLVNDYQTKFSMFIQKFRVKGKAVISIDPIDYLTMSVNNSGWRSCHIITNGCHKAGCLSYMIDGSTAIAFTTDKRITANRKFEGLSYDNKLWRQCVHIGEDFALQARQYPGINPSNKNCVSDLLKDMFNSFYDVSDYTVEDKKADELYGYQYDNPGEAYNDIAHESFSRGGCIVYSDTKSDLDSNVEINKEAICVRCGQHTVSYSDSLVCYDCRTETGYYNDDDEYEMEAQED